MNKNLMAIFKRDKDETWWCPDCHKLIKKESKCSCGCEVFNQVSLVKVLEKLNKNHNTLDIEYGFYDIDKILLYVYDCDEVELFRWKLSDKSGEVPLDRQSKETQDSLWEMLK